MIYHRIEHNMYKYDILDCVHLIYIYIHMKLYDRYAHIIVYILCDMYALKWKVDTYRVDQQDAPLRKLGFVLRASIPLVSNAKFRVLA